MQHNESHSFQDTFSDPFHDLVLNLLMGQMSPPDEHVRIFQTVNG